MNINSLNTNRNSLQKTNANFTKMIPSYTRKSMKGINKVSSKISNFIPNTTREFGKEINLQNNLTTFDNQEQKNIKKSTGVPLPQKNKNLKKEKDEQINKIKNNKQLVPYQKNRKSLVNSLSHKTSIATGKCLSNGGIRNRKKEANKLNIKNQSTQNIFHNDKINLNEDIVMKDENTNPNIVNNKTTSVNVTTNNDEDVEMAIEDNNNNNNNKNEPPKYEEIINSNPQDVEQYFDDICDEFKNYEEKYLVNPDYMSKQIDINYKMRAILIDWLIDVHIKYKLRPQTMYITVMLIDRYLEKNQTDRLHLQLVGVTAMFIACKYEEIYPPEMDNFVYITDGAYVRSDVLKMEKKMLESLNFDVTFPTMWNIFETFKIKLNLDDKTFKMAWFMMELCLMNYHTLKFKMSHLVAGAILIASKYLKVYTKEWFAKIGVNEEELEECCEEIVDFYKFNAGQKLKAIRRKFASSKYGEVSKFKIA